MIHSLKWVMPKSREAVDLWSPTALILQHKSRHSVTFTFIWFEAKTLKLMWRSYLSLFETRIEVCLPVSNESLRCSLYWELFTRWSTVFWYSDIYALFAFLQRGKLKKNHLENLFLKSHRNVAFVEYVFLLQRWWSLLSCRYVTVEDFNISWRWLVLLRSVGKHIYSSPAYQCLHHTTLCSISSNPIDAYWKRYKYSAVQNSLQDKVKSMAVCMDQIWCQVFIWTSYWLGGSVNTVKHKMLYSALCGGGVIKYYVLFLCSALSCVAV